MSITWQERQTNATQRGHDTIKQTIAGLRQLANEMEVNAQTLYQEAMDCHDYPAAMDCLKQVRGVLGRFENRLTEVVIAVDETNQMRNGR